MAFVNEYVSEQNIEQYGLNPLWNKYHRFIEHLTPADYRGYKHMWTIDRERGVWLMKVCTVYDSSPEYSRSGLPEPTRENIFILHWQGVNIEIHLWKSEKSSSKFIEQPFYVIWELISLSPESLNGITKDQIIEVLREALTVYGHACMSTIRIDNIIVELDCKESK